MGWLVDDEWRRIVEHNTKEDRLTRIEACRRGSQQVSGAIQCAEQKTISTKWLIM